MKLRSHGLIAAIALSALLASGLVACGGDDDDGGSTATASGKTAAATTASGDNGAAAEEITIVMTDNKFTPADITVPVGKEVTIEVKNEGAAVHNMHVLSEKAEGKDFTSEALVPPGEDDSFTVKFSKAGKYDFQCDYHLPDMVGTITAK